MNNQRLSLRANTIRGVAIAGIVLFHYFRLTLDARTETQWAYSPDWMHVLLADCASGWSECGKSWLMNLGYTGVPVFFILSGWGLTMKSMQTEARLPNLGRFYARRMWRLLPMYYLSVLLVCCGYAAIHYRDNDYLRWVVEEGVLKILLVHNFVPGSAFSINSVWWYVPTLVFLYLCYPLLLRVCRRAPLISAFVALIIAWGCSLLILSSSAGVWNPALAMGGFPLTRIGEFTVGISMALLLQGQACKKAKGQLTASFAALGAGLLLMAAGVLSLGNAFAYPLHNMLLGMGLILFLVGMPACTGRWQTMLPLRTLGVVSLPLFLFHRPGIPIWIDLFGATAPSWFSAILFLIVAGIGAWLVERATRPVFAKLGTSLGVIGRQ